MTEIYFLIVAFLLLLAVFDLFVGVSNDAVNFLNSAIGAKVAKYRTVLIVASVGILIGAVMSAGMMDVARHGIMRPENYTFQEVMTIFLAVMVTDVVILDIFNTLGMRHQPQCRLCLSFSEVHSFWPYLRCTPTRRSQSTIC